LLNIGPTGDGSIPMKSIDSLKAIGEWMEINGEAIYGTQASPFEKLSWGRCSKKSLSEGKTRLYLHIFDWPADGKLIVPIKTDATVIARRLTDQKELRIVPGAEQMTVLVGEPVLHNIATVVELDIDGPLQVSQ
jgi:alpha-L-fucosidase